MQSLISKMKQASQIFSRGTQFGAFFLLLLSGTAMGEVGEILQAVAPLAAAAGSAGVAAVQASADVKKAQIDAEANISMTKTASETSKYLADDQKDVALGYAYAGAAISKNTNDGVTERLGMQLGELSAARKDAIESQREDRLMQWQLQQAQIRIAERTADDTVKLARETLKMELTAKGLSQGFSNSQNASDRLTVSRNLSTNGRFGGGGQQVVSFARLLNIDRGAAWRANPIGAQLHSMLVGQQSVRGSTNSVRLRLNRDALTVGRTSTSDLTTFQRSAGIPHARAVASLPGSSETGHSGHQDGPVQSPRSSIRTASPFGQ